MAHLTQPYTCLLHGIDTLEVSYCFDTRTGDLDFDALYLAKVKAAEGTRHRWTEITLENEQFFVMPYGARGYGIMLKNADFTIQLGEKMTPNFCVKFSSEGLWRNGPQAQLDRIDSLAKSLNVTPTREPVVGRVDWATDFYVPDPDFDLDHFVSKAKKDRMWRSDRRAQSFTFGKGALVLRVYDKSAEVREESHKEWFPELWGRSDGVWRAEFQARREHLKSFGIRTPADLFSHQYDVLRQALLNHSLRRPNADSNRSRWPYHPLWAALSDVIHKGPQHGLVRSFDPLNSAKVRRAQQVRSMAGSVKGLAALDALIRNQGPPELREFVFRRLPTLLAGEIDPQDWLDDVQAKITCHRMGHR